ncbi:NADH dehydrogenase [ubiquinone] 1 alpha subcomplex subunit 5 [Halotydeus destructor]|nr:NADH dehydrogenase [ubiquinone] 1 alpha subcomplex subunit 5 [Halotydeus destructor]
MAGPIKKTTGLTGLLVARNPHFTLTSLYTKILGTLDKMPQEAAYRKHTEKLVKERMDIVKNELDVSALETKINSGQVEEVILQAENELILARRMLQWKPWEPLVAEAPKNQWKWPM